MVISFKDLPFEDRLSAEEIADMYDETPEAGADGLYGLELNEGLTLEEQAKASKYALMSRGHMLVTGQPGSGKGVFGTSLAWTNRRLFRGKKVFLDFKPRALFDLGQDSNRYHLFNSEFMQNEIKKMAIQSGTEKILDENIASKNKKVSVKDKTKSEGLSLLAKEWRKKNEVLLRSGVLALDEFKRYCYNREPFSIENKVIGSLNSVWRHLDLLILGMCPQKHEIDQYTSLFYVTHEVRCSAMTDGHSFKYRIFKARYVGVKGVIETTGKPEVYFIDGSKPRPEIGNELKSVSFSEDDGQIENMIMEYLLECPKQTANLNMICDTLDLDLNETKDRLLNMHKLGLIECKCYFQLYNSKNFANLSPKLVTRD